jgi:SAM-dependent methyltransferase
MISDDQLPELADFRRVERSASLRDAAEYSRLVVATDNDRSPIHRWYKFKESFSKDLLTQILHETGTRARRSLTVVDPFCGVGTTLVAAQELAAARVHLDAVGIEYNPFIAFVARTKVQWPLIDTALFRDAAEQLASTTHYFEGSLPELSSVSSGLCISKHTSRRLLGTANAIRTNITNREVANALLLGVAAAVEPLSRVRKDGRALRLVSKGRIAIAPTLSAKWKVIADDAELYQQLIGTSSIPTVVQGDGRDLARAGIAANSVDLIVTSPPYPNNIDYTEVYKLELFLLGFLKTNAEFYALRRDTFRSHPTSLASGVDAEFLEASRRGGLSIVLKTLLARTGRMRERWRQKLLLGYSNDLWRALRSFHTSLRPNALAVLVVGNSLHGGTEHPYVIPTDLLVSSIGKRLGFKVEGTLQARALKRRLSGNHFLRESVVILRKTR